MNPCSIIHKIRTYRASLTGGMRGLPTILYAPLFLSSIVLQTTDSRAFTSARRYCNSNKFRESKCIAIGMAGEKRKYVSDGVDVLKSFPALEGKNPLDVHTLILGTLPSDKSYGQDLSAKEILLRGGDGHQNYGNSRNSFWHIIGSAFGFQRHKTPFEEQVRYLTDQGYAVWDVLSAAKRKGSLDANLVKGSLTPTDLPRFILDHPNVNRFVFAANSAEVFCKGDVWGGWLNEGQAATSSTTASYESLESNGEESSEVIVKTKFWIQGSMLNEETFARTNAIFGKKKAVETVDSPIVSYSYSKLSTLSKNEDDSDDERDCSRRLIELIVMPSTSPASARMRPPEKEKKWHIACYRLKEPPQHYVCPGCEYHLETAVEPISRNELPERHWFHDCPYREDWKKSKKEQSKKKTKQQTALDEDDIDPFYWYM